MNANSFTTSIFASRTTNRFAQGFLAVVLVSFSYTTSVGGQERPKAPKSKEINAATWTMPAEVKHYPDVTYRETDKGPLKLDMVAPRDGGDGPFPVVVIIHAIGPWAKDRKFYLPQAADLAREGYVGVVISYRHTPDVAYPHAIEDAEAAIRWLRTHAKQYKIDPDRIAALGYSGGGAIACLLAMKRPEEKAAAKPNLPSCRVQAAVAYYPPTDFTQLHKDCGTAKVPSPKGYFIALGFEMWLGGSPAKASDRYAQASPITHVSKNIAPILLIHGMEDFVVPFEQSQSLATAIGAMKGQVTLVALSGAGHGFEEKNCLNAQIAKKSAQTFLNGHLAQPRSSIIALQR